MVDDGLEVVGGCLEVVDEVVDGGLEGENVCYCCCCCSLFDSIINYGLKCWSVKE